MKTLNSWKLNDKTKISEVYKHGFWLYDKNVGMNISMRAETKEAALIESLEYYQNALSKSRAVNKGLQETLDSIASLFPCEDCEVD